VCQRPATPASLAPLTNGLGLPGPIAALFGVGDGVSPFILPSFELPCTAYTPLDCFSEGDWNYHMPDMNPVWNASKPNMVSFGVHSGQLDPVIYGTVNQLPNTYLIRPSFKNLPSSVLNTIIQKSCPQWAGVYVPMGFIYGKVERNITAGSQPCTQTDSYSCPVKTVQSTETVWTANDIGPQAVRLCMQYYRVMDPVFAGVIATNGADWATVMCVAQEPAQMFKDAAESILLDWESAWMAKAAELASTSTYTNIRYFTDRSTDDVADGATGDIGLVFAGFALLIVFAAATGWANDLASSQVCTKLLGVLMIVVSVASGLGLSALFGIKFTGTTIQLMPFVGLAMGVFDIFVLSDSYRFDYEKEPSESIRHCIREGGTSITISSSITFISFLIVGLAVPVPGVASYALIGVLVVLLNWVMNFFAFQSLMVITHERMRRGYSSDICCMRVTSRPQPCCGSSSDIQQLGTSTAPRIVKIASHGAEIPGEAKASKCVIWYAEMLSKLPVKLLIIAAFIGIFAAGLNGCTKVEDGQPASSIVPKDSYAYSFLTLRDSDYSDFPASFMVGMKRGSAEADTSIDWEAASPKIFAAENALTAVPGVNKLVPIYGFSAWDHFISWLNLKARNFATGACTAIPECSDCNVCMSSTYSQPYPTPYFYVKVPGYSSNPNIGATFSTWYVIVMPHATAVYQ
jgi:hypothetical protein